MKNLKNIDRKALGLLISFLIVMAVVWAVYPQGPITDSAYYPGTQTETTSYLIFVEGSTIYAKDGTTGAISFSGTNASEIINNCAYQLSLGTYTGGTIELSGGTPYYLDSPIQYYTGQSFTGWGEYSTILRVTSLSSACFEPIDPTVRSYRLGISDLSVQLNSSDGVSSRPAIDLSNHTRASIQRVSVWSRGSAKRWLYGVFISHSAYYNEIKHCSIGRSSVASIYLGGITNDRANDNYVLWTMVGEGGATSYPTYGILCNYSDNNELKHIQLGGDTGIYLGYALNNFITSARFEYANTVGINITSNAYGTTLLMGCPLGTITDVVDTGVSTFMTWYNQTSDQMFVKHPNNAHPIITAWGSQETGFTWYCSTHDVLEYWNGTDIITP